MRGGGEAVVCSYGQTEQNQVETEFINGYHGDI